MKRPLVVMIPACGRPQLLARTLDSLARCGLPETYQGMLVIENAGKCGLEEVVGAADPRLRASYLYCGYPGRSAALNVGLEHAGDALVYMTDDDIRFSPGVLHAYVGAAEGIDGGCIFGGPLGVDRDADPPAWLEPYLPRSAKGWQPDPETEWNPKMDFLGANWAAFAKDLNDAGGFNPLKGSGAPTGAVGQETDMQMRLDKRGVRRIYVPEAIVWHYVPPARCSVAWALDRYYRAGIEEGLREVDRSVTLFGFPRWMCRRWLAGGLRWALGRLRVDRRARFEASRDFWYYCGLMMGRRRALLEARQRT